MPNVTCPKCGGATETRANRKGAIHGVCLTPWKHAGYKGKETPQMELPEMPPKPKDEPKKKGGFLDRWF